MATVAVLGLGAMGRRVAKRLAQAGHELRVWSRGGVPADVPELVRYRAETPAACVTGAAVAISLLRDDAASKQVWEAALPALSPGALMVESSTLSPGWVSELAAEAARRGLRFLDAPVVGSRPQADAGALVHLVGGTEEDLTVGAPFLAVLGQAVHRLGPPPAGTLAKLLVNTLFAGQVALLAELLGAARAHDLDPRAFLAALGQLPVASPAVKVAGGAMLDEMFAPLFPIELVAKDLGYAASLAPALPVTNRVHEVFADAAATGLSHKNITAIALLYLADPPVPPHPTHEDTSMSTLYTAKVTIQGGRDGSVKSDDGRLDLKLAVPKVMGGTGDGANTEQLFAAGYGSCFASTIKTIARATGKPVGEVEVQADVDINVDGGTYDLAVRLTVRAPGVDAATLESLIEGAKAACPYSRATRNNITTTVTVSA